MRSSCVIFFKHFFFCNLFFFVFSLAIWSYLLSFFSAVNACVRVKLSTLGNDAEELFEVLSNPELHCEEILNEELKPIYLEELKNEYQNKDKNFVLFSDRIQAIVREANSITPQQRNGSLYFHSFNLNKLKLEILVYANFLEKQYALKFVIFGKAS